MPESKSERDCWEEMGPGTGDRNVSRTDTLASETEQFKLESALLAPGERTAPWVVHDAPIQLLLPARFLTVRL